MSSSLGTNGGPVNRNNSGDPQRTVAIAQAGRSSIEYVRIKKCRCPSKISDLTD